MPKESEATDVIAKNTIRLLLLQQARGAVMHPVLVSVVWRLGYRLTKGRFDGFA